MSPLGFQEHEQWSTWKQFVNLGPVQVVPKECRNSEIFLSVIFKKQGRKFFVRLFEAEMVGLVTGYAWRISSFPGIPREMTECF
jgi:hypothetical protein